MRQSLIFALILTVSSLALAQGQPASDPQALAFAAQSIAAITGGSSVNDVTLTANAAWTGSDTETGNATLKALGTGESRVDLVLSGGTRTEIRDASTGFAQGKWTAQDGSSGPFESHNCFTDAVWFFPTLTSLSAGANVVLSYIGPETRNGTEVQHLQSYIYQPSQNAGGDPSPQQLSTMDFYLDASTLLPVAITYNMHPDEDANANILVEIDYSHYQMLGGVSVPLRIQRYSQGTLLLDLTVTSAEFNIGLALSTFAIN